MQAEYKVVFNRKKKLNSKGKALVQIEVYLEGNRKYFSTDIYVTPQEWKPSPLKAKYITDAYKNKLIVDKIQELMNFEQKYRFNNNGKFLLSEFDILNQPKPVKPIVLTFTEFYAQQLEIEKQNIQDVTWQQQKTNLVFLTEYCPVIAFEDLTYTLIEGYDQFLKSRKGRDGNGMKLNSVDKRHRQMKKYIALAINHGHLPYEQNPYLKFKSKKESVNKVWLTKQEWERIENLTFDKQSIPLLELVRDMFLFSTYTGLRYSDVDALTKNNFQSTEKGLELELIAKKTNKPFRLPLYLLFNGKAEVIAQKYIERGAKRLFYGVTNPKANLLIKEIAKIAQIKKHITYHDSRDTFGTHLVRLVPITVVQSLMQHGDIRTSKGYFHMDDSERNNILENTDWNK